MRGKIIVIEGGDGAGKATQTKLLTERLMADGQQVETMSFPRYEDNTFGALIRECLDGKRGNFIEADPYFVSTLFAADRFESKAQIEAWLAAGSVVVLDRYTTANMLHQGAKTHDDGEREKLLSWIHKIEHEIFMLPEPDIVFYLQVPAEERQELLKQQHQDRGTGPDQADSNLEHQSLVEASAATIMNLYPHWHLVDCMLEGEGQLRTPEHINEELYSAVCDILE